MSPLIKKSIAFFGPAGSGKTTMARELADYYGGKRLAFADALKKRYAKEFNIDIQELTKIPNKYKHRNELQRYGDETRDENPSVWVDALMEEFNRHYRFGTRIFFVDDVRFPEEYEALKNAGFIMVRVEGVNVVLTEEEAKHPSELYWQDFEADYELSWVQPMASNGYSTNRAILDRLAELYLVLDRETAVWNAEQSRSRR